MRCRSQLGRADLLKCLAVVDEAEWEGLAEALGYARRAPIVVRDQVGNRITGVLAPIQGKIIIGPSATPKAQYYRVVAHRSLEPSEVVRDEPDWFRFAELIREETEICADSTASPLNAPPLMRWSRLWPFLKRALGSQRASQALNLPLIIERLARAKVLRDLPRKQRQDWAAGCQVIIDYAASLRPFWSDFNRLRDQLQDLRGRCGLQVVAFPDGLPGDRCWVYSGQDWQTVDNYPLPVRGAAVLVLSDLGCLDKTDERRRQWRRLGLRLARAGCRPVALMPCPVRWWDENLVRLFYPVCWDRAQRLPKGVGVRRAISAPAERVASDAGVAQLLALLAPAIRVEPALLRAVRYLLPSAVADVGVEAAVWNHPDVHATPLAFYYDPDPDKIAHYRAQFKAEQDDLRKKTAGLIRAHHRYLSLAIGDEENLLLADLEGTSAPDANRFMERTVKTLHTQDGAFSESLRAWIARLTQRQHRSMWGNEVLAAAWATVFLVHRKEDRTPPPGLDLNQISWLLGRGQISRRYKLLQRGQALYAEIGTNLSVDSKLDSPGSPLGEIDATSPWLQLQRNVDAPTFSADFKQTLHRPVELETDGHLRLRTDHQELTIEPFFKPAWAEAIGRDEQGLWVAWQSGQRRARWLNPGPYPVYTKTGDLLHVLPMANGAWCDEAEALPLIHSGFRQPDWAEDWGVDDHGLYAGLRIKGVYLRLRWIVPGEFQMGSPEDEVERDDDETPHQVILTHGYWLAETACTQALWQAVMGKNPSDFKGAERPVETVSWEEVQRFIEWLNRLAGDEVFRLPTEAEWEYACRAGTTTPFSFGANITPEQVNYDGNYPYAKGPKGEYREATVEVKALPCNAWGLYQMHGNVLEWCQDWYGEYPADTTLDPVGPATGDYRVLRGGGWIYYGGSVRSAVRYYGDPGFRFHSYGFRLARGQAASQVAPEAQQKQAGQG